MLLALLVEGCRLGQVGESQDCLLAKKLDSAGHQIASMFAGQVADKGTFAGGCVFVYWPVKQVWWPVLETPGGWAWQVLPSSAKVCTHCLWSQGPRQLHNI